MHDETIDSLERTSASHLPVAHGGELVDLYVDPERRAEIKTESKGLPSWDLTPRQLCDLELLLNGGFSPLRGFMKKADYERVCNEMRLASGILWPIPITLDVSEDFAKSLTAGRSKFALRDPEGVMLALLHVEEVWKPDRRQEAQAVFNTTSPAHPGVNYVLNKANPWHVEGRLESLEQTPGAFVQGAQTRSSLAAELQFDRELALGSPSERRIPIVTT